MFDGLAPRRRRLLLGALASVLVAVLAGVVLIAVARRGGAPAAAQDHLGPVVLVPGYGGSQQSLAALAGRLRADGRDATVLALPGDGTGDLDGQARALQAAVGGVLRRTGAPSVDLIGYSAGGVVARLYVARHGGRARVRRVVTLGSPHHGTDLAASADAVVPGACVDACAQLLPGSDLLRTLPATPTGPRWLSLWTEDDTTVTPPDTARLAGAVDVDLQRICAGERVSHGGLPDDALVQGIVLRALSAAPLTAPSPGDCATLRTR